jgi:two-component system sensor histidine kinase AtoS
MGPGIPKANLLQIFDPFFTTKENGTGLGLPISYEIIRHHGGEILVKSKPGEGADFSIWLPLAAE